MYHSSKCVIYLLVVIAWSLDSLPETHAWSNTAGPTSRRVFLHRASAATGMYLLTSPPALADEAAVNDDTKMDNKLKAERIKAEKEAAARKRAEEKEARRLAEETKKRLAVGRIGAF